MRFIAACVGFTVFVLLCLILPNTEKGKKLFGEYRQERETMIYRVDEQMARIDIHDIVVLNTEPKTYAIAGVSDTTGMRELWTATDSVVETSNYLKWAKEINDSYDWSETENPVYKFRGSYIQYYNLDSLFEADIIHSIYHVDYTNYNFERGTTYAESIIVALGLFLLGYFIFSFAIDWSPEGKFKFVAFAYCLCFFIFYAALSLTFHPSLTMGAWKFVILHLVHLILYGMVICAHYFLKSNYRSNYIYQGAFYLVIVLSFPLAYFILEGLMGIGSNIYSVFSNFSIVHFRTISFYMMMGMGIGLADLAVFWRKHYKEVKEEKYLALQSQLRTKDQLNSLNARLNPHFLYNSLNSIAGLIHQDPHKAEEMTLAISRFLKHFSNRKEQHVIAVREEVDVILDYISIEKIRFEEKLRFAYEVDDMAMGINIPRSILQPLIENAVKYGYDKESGQISVSLVMEVKDAYLVIHIYDSGSEFDAALDKGYGISSVYNKLDLLYKDQYSIGFVNEPKKHIEIIIPSLTSAAHA